MSDVLATAGLTKRYGGLMANDGVAIALAAGEIRGLIGPNGAGKTTFVNLVTGIERPDEGEILLDGSAITGLGPHRVAAPRPRTLVPGGARVRQSHGARKSDGPVLRIGTHTGHREGHRAHQRTFAALHMRSPTTSQIALGGQRMLLQACAGFMIPE